MIYVHVKSETLPSYSLGKVDKGELVLDALAVTCGRLHVTSRSESMSTTRPLKSSEKVRAHRARLRQRGLRPIQMWVPDVRSRAFAREAHRQSVLVANKAIDGDDQNFVDAVSDWPPE